MGASLRVQRQRKHSALNYARLSKHLRGDDADDNPAAAQLALFIECKRGGGRISANFLNALQLSAVFGKRISRLVVNRMRKKAAQRHGNTLRKCKWEYIF